QASGRSADAMASSGEVQRSLQAVAQGLRWTYALLWQLCPDQGALVWAEGHYNGAIKTRKTVQPAVAQAQAQAPAAEAADQARSRQLRELFDSLAREAAAGGGPGFRDVHGCAQEARRPSAALAPEDLTETEWFYLMSASYSFPPGVGLPGRAFARGGHVWLSRANEVDSKAFSRAILARVLFFS
uniref:Transcription factor MYC/MYB N-terminal domain-containing protein n=1 Tax=Aegilops tauschii subsp. strangulata TaxID=200361 RepID=A0A452XZD7_AEGTS